MQTEAPVTIRDLHRGWQPTQVELDHLVAANSGDASLEAGPKTIIQAIGDPELERTLSGATSRISS